MKNFVTPLSITGTPRQLEELMLELEALGYAKYHITPDWHTRSVLVTRAVNRYCPQDGWEFTNLSFESLSSQEGTRVSANNKDLVLALAAMTDDDKRSEGEWYVCLYSTNYFKKDKLYQLKGNDMEALEAFEDDKGYTPFGDE